MLGKEIRADYVLEGSVRRSGERLRLPHNSFSQRPDSFG